jgi:hypothetical protein
MLLKRKEWLKFARGATNYGSIIVESCKLQGEFGPRGAWAQGGMRYRNDFFSVLSVN